MNEAKNINVDDEEDGRLLFLTPEEIAADDAETDLLIKQGKFDLEVDDPFSDELFDESILTEATRASLADVSKIKFGDFILISDPSNHSNVHKQRAMLYCAKFGKYYFGFVCKSNPPAERYDDFYLPIDDYAANGLLRKSYLDLTNGKAVSIGGIMQAQGHGVVLGSASESLKKNLQERLIKFKFIKSQLNNLNYEISDLIEKLNNN